MLVNIVTEDFMILKLESQHCILCVEKQEAPCLSVERMSMLLIVEFSR